MRTKLSITTFLAVCCYLPSLAQPKIETTTSMHAKGAKTIIETEYHVKLKYGEEVKSVSEIITYTFDSNGRITSSEHNTSVSYTNKHIDYKYDESGRIDSVIYNKWNSWAGECGAIYKFEYQNGKLAWIRRYQNDEVTGAWKYAYKGNEYTVTDYDEYSEGYVSTYRNGLFVKRKNNIDIHTHTYNAQKQLIRSEFRDYPSNKLRGYDKHLYNAKGLLTSSMRHPSSILLTD